MSYRKEHIRLKPVLDLVHQLDIASNPEAHAIFEAGSAGFQVWCTPQDCPPGWDNIQMIAGTFSKPCEYLGSVYWKWEDETIVALEIETSAYALAEQKPDEYCDWDEIPQDANYRSIFNRDDDIEWLKEKVTWLFEQVGIELPPFEYKQVMLPQSGPHILAQYIASDGDHYVVIASPNRDPQEFCKPGYVLTDTVEVWGMSAFPVDTPLIPADEDYEPNIEPDEGPLVEQYENSSRLGDDNWLEAAYEDRSGGWDE